MISQRIKDSVISALIVAMIAALFSMYMDVQQLKWRDRYFHGEVAK